VNGVTAAILAYTCQVSALAFAAWLALVVGRVRAPRLQLLHYQTTLAAAVVLLPGLAWANLSIASPDAVVFSAPRVLFRAGATGVDATGATFGWPWAIGLVLVAGVVVRTAWLAMGAVRLRRIRIAARELDPLPPVIAVLHATCGIRARWLVTDAVAVAATCGVRDPVVLLSATDLHRSDAALRAVACHELRHVARRDWLWTVAEEAIRTALWFQPGIWFLVDRIRLCREQVVDADVIALMGDRVAYGEALIESAAAARRPHLAPAWLHTRHLPARILSIATGRGGPMPTRRFVPSAVALAAVLAAACAWSACAFPSHDDRRAAGAAAGAAAPAAASDQPSAASDAARPAAPPAEAPASSAPPTAPSRPAAADVTTAAGIKSVQISNEQPWQPPATSSVVDPRSPREARAGVTLPRLLSQVKPDYTPDAMKAKIHGDVWIDAVIDEHGTPRDLRVTRSLDRVHGLDQQALAAAGKWKFEPGTVNGSPAPLHVAIVMTFRLR
jgi:protein TonB